MVVIRRQYLSK